MQDLNKTMSTSSVIEHLELKLNDSKTQYTEDYRDNMNNMDKCKQRYLKELTDWNRTRTVIVADNKDKLEKSIINQKEYLNFISLFKLVEKYGNEICINSYEISKESNLDRDGIEFEIARDLVSGKLGSSDIIEKWIEFIR